MKVVRHDDGDLHNKVQLHCVGFGLQSLSAWYFSANRIIIARVQGLFVRLPPCCALYTVSSYFWHLCSFTKKQVQMFLVVQRYSVAAAVLEYCFIDTVLQQINWLCAENSFLYGFFFFRF